MKRRLTALAHVGVLFEHYAESCTWGEQTSRVMPVTSIRAWERAAHHPYAYHLRQACPRSDGAAKRKASGIAGYAPQSRPGVQKERFSMLKKTFMLQLSLGLCPSHAAQDTNLCRNFFEARNNFAVAGYKAHFFIHKALLFTKRYHETIAGLAQIMAR